ncbi:MAG: 50S ribosomal protein L19e [Candidatus Marsarchaeota archaeon]|jgi:large subunit ribosomal protein L19e|nr:50S ribosomal protein L19e [Candidatus Marsarchaeota archaeon]MCL5418364.1 50S ribosomal protein L19e [Candidatus Marsarchaeota archaeon]
MSLKTTKRIASELLNRGSSSVRIKPSAIEDAQKALTKDDVRSMISKGDIYAIKEKHNMSIYAKLLNAKRSKGRKRGRGRRKGTLKARSGDMHKKEVRALRRVLGTLKADNTIDGKTFKTLYRLVRGGNFASKASLLNHIRTMGIEINDERFEKLRHM